MSDFAKLVIEVDSSGAVTAKKVLGDLGAEAGKTETKTKTMGDRFRDLQAVMQGPVAAFNAIKGAVVAVAQTTDMLIMKAAESEAAIAILGSTIRSTGADLWTGKRDLIDYADSMSKLTLFDDDDILRMQGVLLGFRNITGDSFTKASTEILNMSTVMKMDLTSAAQAVGKALDDPIKGLDSLSKQGFKFSDAEKEMLRSLVETNKMAEAQDIIIKELAKTFGGASEAVANMATGQYQNLKKAYGEFTESLGGSIANDPLVNLIVTSYTEAFTKLADIMDEKTKALKIESLLKPLLQGPFSAKQVAMELDAMGLEWSDAVDVLTAKIDKLNKVYNEPEDRLLPAYTEALSKYGTLLSYARDQASIEAEILVKKQKQAEKDEKAVANAEQKAKLAEEEYLWQYRIETQAYSHQSLAERKSMGILGEESPAEAVLDRERELGIAIANNNELSKDYNVTLEVTTADMKTMGGAVEELARNMYALTEAEKLSNAAYKDLEKTFADFGAGVLFDLSSAYFNAIGEAIGGSTTAAQDMADTMRELGQSILDELPRLMFYAGIKMLEVDPTLGIALILGSGLVSIGAGAYRAGVASAGGSAPIAETPTLPTAGGGVSLSIINQSGVALQGDVMETQSATGGRSLELTVRRMVANTIASGGADSALRSRPNGRAIPLRRG